LLSGSELMSIVSKSNAARETKASVFPRATVEATTPHTDGETAGAPASLPTTAGEERIERMQQLADIFASIFEALPDNDKRAIATTRDAA
jgi:hypothetical protein